MSDRDEIRRREKEKIDRIKEKSEDDFEKQLTFIASGALAISFTFLEKVVNLDKSIYLALLAAAWALLVITLCINLASHYISKSVGEINGEALDSYLDRDERAEHSGEDYDHEETYQVLAAGIKRRNWYINLSNYFSVGFLFLGLILLIIFVTLNINHVSQTKPSNPKTEKLGRTFPVPPQPQRPQPQQTSNNTPPAQK